MPKPYLFHFLLHIIFLLPILNNHHHVKATNNGFIYAACSSELERYEPNSAYELNLRNLLTSLVTSSSQSLYGSFAITNDSSTYDAYGLYQCRGDLKLRDCLRCVESVASQVQLVCPYTYGASLQFGECLIRYERTDFLGKLDTGLRYKKCGKSVSGDPEFFKRRDEVLAEMMVSFGFRVSKAGLVEGFAQCVGDLTASDCSVCLADAVQKIKTVCGYAEAADVFLGQCYARCWASGYYDSSQDSSSNDDQVGKTVAIIIGVVAGLAVLIILLSVCRKSLA